MQQKLGNDPLKFAYDVMRAPLLSTPVCVDFEDDVLPLPHRVHDDSSLALEIVSLLDDTSSESGKSSQSSLSCDMNEDHLNEQQEWEVETFESGSTNSQFGSKLTKYSNDEECNNNNCTPETTTRYNEYHHQHSCYSGYHCCPHYPHYPNYCHYCTGQQGSSLRGQCDMLARLNAINATQQTEITNLKQRCTILEMQVMHCHLGANYPSDNNKPLSQKRHRFCGMIGCPGLGGKIYCPKYKALKNDSPTYKRRKTSQCQVCLQYGLNLNCKTGSGNRKRCKFFNIDGSPKCPLCNAFNPMGLDCGAGGEKCKKFELSGSPIQIVQT